MLHSHLSLAAALLLAAGVSAQTAVQGKSYTNWDCCKPACASRRSRRFGGGDDDGGGGSSANLVNTCDIENNLMDRTTGRRAPSGCQSSESGASFMCDTYAPVPVSEELSYGFVVKMGRENCCKCYDVTWTSGAGAGKRMIVQSVNVAEDVDESDVRADDLVVIVPGGGVGRYPDGCMEQYGATWGAAEGGVSRREGCEALPPNLQGGCYWRWNWARGGINGWDISYSQVECPARLSDISGCSA